MNDSEMKKKFATAKGPVNRRLVSPGTASPAQDAPVVQARLQAVKAKQRLGATLAARLASARGKPDQAKALGATEIMMAVGGTISAVGLVLGLIQSSTLITLVSAVGVCGFGLTLYLAARSKRQLAGIAPEQRVDLIDHDDIKMLDKAMEKLALDASQATLDKLSGLKALITRCASLVSSAPSGQAVSNDDQLFIRECVRRYLPDSIHSYCRVPEKDRASLVIEDGKTALALLHDQMDMLLEQLHIKEQRLAQMAGDSLMQQQRFLAAKTKTER
jgi:hypothetical protein